MNKLIFLIPIVLACLIGTVVYAADNPVSASELIKSPIYGRAYTPQCLGECHLVMKVAFGGLADLSKSAADSYQSSYLGKTGASASSCIIESHYDILVNKSVWSPKMDCTPALTPNGTATKTCADKGGYVNVPSWVNIKDFKPTEKGKDYYIDLVATKKVGSACSAVDAVPVLLNQQLKQYAWWNTSWNYYKNITLTAGTLPMVNVTVPINVTYDAHMVNTFADLRFLNGANVEQSFWVENKVDGSYADVWLRVPYIEEGTSAIVSMYYGNPAAATTSDPFSTWLHYDDFRDQAVGSDPSGWSITEGGSTKINIVSNVTKFGNRAVIYTGDGASQAESSYAFIFPKKFRYKSWTQIGVAVDGVYETLKEGGNPDVNTRYLTGPKWVYYDGGNVQLDGGWTTGVWYSTQILGDTATDLANYTWNGATADLKPYRTVTTTAIDSIYYTGPDGAAGTNYLGAVMVGNYSGSDPTYSFGAEHVQSAGPPILIYGNTTNAWTVRSGSSLTFGISAKNATPTAVVSSVVIDVVGANQTASFTGGNEWSWTGALTAQHGNYTIRQYAQNETGEFYTNSSTYFIVQVFSGLNLSAFNKANSSAITGWNVTITNGTASYASGALNNGAFIDGNNVPRGPLNVTFWKGYYQTTIYTTTFTGSEYTAIDAQLPRLQEFRAKNADDGGSIATFSVVITNGTSTASFNSAGSYYVIVGQDQLPIGLLNITTQSFGFQNNLTTINMLPSASINQTALIPPAGIWLQARDEGTLAVITFNVTIANSTASWTVNNNNPSLAAYFTNGSLPKGDVSVMFMAGGYGARTYYTNINQNGMSNITAYLLPSASGSWVRFHTLTITDVGIENVLVSATRQISGVQTLIGEQLTDSSGTSLMFLDPLTSYTITAVKTGYSSATITINPSQSDYVLRMYSGVTTNISTQFSDIWWNYYPGGCGGIINSSAQVFNFTITSSNSTAITYGMNITVNGTLAFSGIGAGAQGGSINATLNLTNQTGNTVTSILWFNKTGYSVYTWRYDCFVSTNTTGNATLWNVMMTMSSSVCPVKLNHMGVLWCPPLAFLTLIIAMVVGGAAAAKFSFNGGGMAVAAVLWIASYVQWWPWQAAFILTCAALAITILRGGTGV